MNRVIIALAKNAGRLQNGSRMLLLTLTSRFMLVLQKRQNSGHECHDNKNDILRRKERLLRTLYKSQWYFVHDFFWELVKRMGMKKFASNTQRTESLIQGTLGNTVVPVPSNQRVCTWFCDIFPCTVSESQNKFHKKPWHTTYKLCLESR